MVSPLRKRREGRGGFHLAKIVCLKLRNFSCQIEKVFSFRFNWLERKKGGVPPKSFVYDLAQCYIEVPDPPSVEGRLAEID